MKQILQSFILLSALLLSSVGYAEVQNCSFQVNQRAPSEINIKDLFEGSFSRTYQSVGARAAYECFQKAINLAANMVNHFPLEGYASIVTPDGQQTGRTVYYRTVLRWTYNDSYINDSDGVVTAFTRDCVRQHEPDIEENFTGGKRYWSNCSQF